VGERLARIIADLAAEHEALDSVVAQLDQAEWEHSTPAPGWRVRDQIAHLALVDERAVLALTDPEGYAAQAERDFAAGGLDADQRARADVLDGAGMLAWWRHARQGLLDAVPVDDEQRRVPWYGPPMSMVSFVTARLMETWAHGQDVVDAVGAEREPSERLRHVVEIGYRARPWSYRVHGLEPPDEPVRLELKSPSGEQWRWGPDDAVSVVRGSALDFCLVATQRRHVDDTGLEASDEEAARWLGIAQAFAGPAGEGRQPGQFGRSSLPGQ
jgi:uncharacterized protein (TIGR03084 family)